MSRPDVSAITNNGTIVVEAETMRGKDYLTLTYEILTKGQGWKGLKNFYELWIVFPGFEIARNYYQIQKCIKLIQNELSVIFKKEIVVKVFAPDLMNQQIIEVCFENIYIPTFQINATRKSKSTQTLISKIGLENVKGLKEEKEFLLQLKSLNELNANLGIGGILFYGLPGCGKTYLAKSFAQEIGWNYYSFSPADIQSEWVGKTQQNIRDIFKQAKSKSPAILFIDELDSIAFNRDNEANVTVHSDQKATINQLLIEMNNIGESQVLVIGATNFLKTLDPSIKRTGRFDLKIPILPPDKTERIEIIGYYAKKLNDEMRSKQKLCFELTDDEIERLADKTKKFTSSDIKAIFNRPRIDILLNKENTNTIGRLSDEIDDLINTGQLSLTQNQVKSFIQECEQNRVKSKKLDELKNEWGINTNKIGFVN